MQEGKIANIKTNKKKIIKAKIYKPKSGYSSNGCLTKYYKTSRSKDSRDEGCNSDVKISKSRNTPLKGYNTANILKSPLEYNNEK